METFWIFKEYISGGAALFKTYEEADTFRRKCDIVLIESLGEAMDPCEWDIFEVELNPDFKTWWDER